MKRLVPLLALLTLGACAPEMHCPILTAYTQLEQQALAAELPADGPETQAQIEDYIKLRQACRTQ